MKIVSETFKTNISKLGRELDDKLYYTENGETVYIPRNTISSITPYYKSNILKSCMKELEIYCDNEIPKGTILTYELGVKVRDDEVEDYRDNYEYINYGNYIVEEIEKNEDTYNYRIVCYDKMLYSMVDYENLGITYPISIRNYLDAICSHLGLTFANSSSTFTNYNQNIPSELYLDSEGNSIGYTFRDVLDELAQATASTICINDDDKLEVRYLNDTNTTIGKGNIKDESAQFGEKYGPINSIVLSRSAESDNVYLRDEESVAENGLCEIKIVDNQIMNGNNRSDYLPGILNTLDGIEYHTNDYSSIGIPWYELCDKYDAEIGDETYNCIMFNNESYRSDGFRQNIFTDLPEGTVTDYKKADKTDRRINQTYLIVDKQNQVIEGVVSQVADQNEQIAIIRLQYNELLSRISDIADITTSGESSYATVDLADVNTSQPIDIKIKPIGDSISYLYPHNVLYPSSATYLKNRTLRFENTDTNEIFDWTLPTNLWYLNSTVYDELELNYGDGTNSTVTVTRRCQVDANGSVSALTTPTTETYPYPSSLVLTDGDYTISLLGYTSGYLYVQLMAKNIYTTQFYTKAETNSLISQTASSIDLSVNQKLSNYSTTSEMNSAISLTANDITSTVSANYVGNNEVISKINQSAEAITIDANKLSLAGKTINMTSDNIAINSTNFSVDKNGNITAKSGDIGSWSISDDGIFNDNGFYINNYTLTNGDDTYNCGISNIYTMSDILICQLILENVIHINTNTPEFRHYDVNGDGVINSTDLLLIRKLVNQS